MGYLKLLFIPFMILAGFNIPGSNPQPVQWLITKGCSLKVDGSTNVNKFSCIISEIYRPDTLTLYRGADPRSTTVAGSLRIDVRDFNCNNPVMTGDLRKTLKSKEFPQMVIRFISLRGYQDYNEKLYAMNGIVSIELAGVAKKFNIAYTISPAGKNTFALKGVKQINFSDFNIVPPRKVGGMIQTSDKLIIEFALAMQVLD